MASVLFILYSCSCQLLNLFRNGFLGLGSIISNVLYFLVSGGDVGILSLV